MHSAAGNFQRLCHEEVVLHKPSKNSSSTAVGLDFVVKTPLSSLITTLHLTSSIPSKPKLPNINAYIFFPVAKEEHRWQLRCHRFSSMTGHVVTPSTFYIVI
jgi:hypothetical protein